MLQTYARMESVQSRRLLSSKRSSDDGYDEPSRAGKAYDGDGFAFVRVAKSFRDDGAVAEFADPGDANTGEIVIGGACVCEGYLNDAALTSKTFVDSPLGRVYRSGDVGFVHAASGDLILLGRIDRRVKIRGNRVELDDIEAALKNCALVADAAIAFDATAQVITAHARVKAPTFDATTEAWMYAAACEFHCRSTLPKHATPSNFVFITHDNWPLTSSGKVDRVTLDSWLRQGKTRVFRPDAVTPERGLESIVARAWSAALGVDAAAIGALDSIDQVRSIHWSPYDRVGVVNVVP